MVSLVFSQGWKIDMRVDGVLWLPETAYVYENQRSRTILQAKVVQIITRYSTLPTQTAVDW